MKKIKSLYGKLIGLLLQLSILVLQLACLLVLYRYYEYGGSYRPKTGAKFFVESGDYVYLIALLALLPFAIISLSNVFKQLIAMIKNDD